MLNSLFGNSMLPQGPGLLPYALIATGTMGLTHSLVCYTADPSVANAPWTGAPVAARTALLAHVYAGKNVYTGFIRLYAAYNIANAQCYDLGMLTFIGVLALYSSELFIWKTTRLRECSIPFVQSGGLLLWMWLQRGFYLGGQ